jgi:sec-independent protein translocase protein TatA
LSSVIGDILQPTHLLFVLVVALLVLGPKRLPEAGKSLGKGLRDFRQALSGEEHDRPNEVVASTAASPQPVAATPAEAVHQPAEPVHQPAETAEPAERVG